MKLFKYFFFALALSFWACGGASNQDTEPIPEPLSVKQAPIPYHNEDFNWSIDIPGELQAVSPETWAKTQQKGADAVGETFGINTPYRPTILFVYKNEDLNTMEANYQPFDVEVDGDYAESCALVNEMIYETLRSQMPDAPIDSSSSVDTVDGLEFQKFYMKITYPDGREMYNHMMSRLFGKREFSLNIMYRDPLDGKKMLDAWHNSTFGK